MCRVYSVHTRCIKQELPLAFLLSLAFLLTFSHAYCRDSYEDNYDYIFKFLGCMYGKGADDNDSHDHVQKQTGKKQ